MISLQKAANSLTRAVAGPIGKMVPEKYRDTFFLRAFGLMKVPMIYFTGPSAIQVTAERCEIKIPFTRRTKNHLNSMYFGALATGADCAGGLIAMKLNQEEGDKVNLIFKNFQANFLKRAEGDVHFSCEQGLAIRALVKKAIASGEREEMPVDITATVPSKLGNEPVAKFILTLSLKRKK